ncbi:cell wall surface anchor family protein [Minicystis rosea]|nr:cell wall surface anchor family protein [Minicystis rosea]
MEIYKKSRSELKAYFVKNALPTESNFRDLIDAGLNQKDDGFVKAADQPAQIAASTAGNQPAIHLHESFATDAKPAWVLSLQAGGQKGFGVGDGDGNNRLFIDAATGGVGIGTTDVAGNKLRVMGNVVVDGTDGNAHLSFGSKNRQMLNLYGEGYGIGVQAYTTYFRALSCFAFYTCGTHSDRLLDPGTGGTAALVIKDGNVGIGTTDPAGNKLRVMGNVLVDGTDGKARVSFGSSTRQMLNLWAEGYGIGVQDSTTYFRTGANFAFYKGGVHSDTALEAGASGAAVLVIKDGNVGIGTTAPKSKHHVVGDLALGLDTNNAKFLIHSRGSNQGDFLQITHDDANGNWTWGQGIVLRRGGNVGIGTNDPGTNKLRVMGDVLVDGSDNTARLSFGSKNRQMLNLYKEEHGIGVQGGTTYFRSSGSFAFYKGGAHSEGALEAGTGGTAVLVIKDGNVGIGTTDPGANKLRVKGNVFVDGADGTAMLALKDGNVGIGTTDPGTNKLRVAGNMLVDGSDSTARLSFGSKNRQMLNLFKEEHGIGVQGSTTYFRSSTNFAFYKGGAHSEGALEAGTGGTAVLVIKDGNVGIGTTSPSEGLSLASSATLMLGADDTNRQVDNGKIAYKRWTRGLDIVGAADSTDGSKRLITFHAQGGSEFVGPIRMKDNAIYLRGDSYHGIGFWNGVEAFTKLGTIDGPVIFGYKGGALGTTFEKAAVALQWDTNGLLYTRFGIISSSDLTLKTDIEPVKDALAQIRGINAVHFSWKDAPSQGRQLGLIAQNVETVFPEVVSTNGMGTKGIDYARLVAPLIEAVKELAAEVEALKAARAS